MKTFLIVLGIVVTSLVVAFIGAIYVDLDEGEDKYRDYDESLI